MEKSVKHKDELKLAVKRFVIQNVSQLIIDGADDEQAGEIVTEILARYTNEAIEELRTSLTLCLGGEVKHG